MTLGTARALIRSLLGPGSDSWITDSQIDLSARHVLNRAAEEARYIVRVSDSSVAASTAVTLPTDLIRVLRVETDSDGVMEPTTTRELWRRNREWRSQTSRPRYYYRDTLTTAAGVEQLWFYPAGACDYLINYEAYPTTPSDANEMEIPKWASGLVVYGVLAEVYEMDTPRRNFKTADLYRRMHDMVLGELTTVSRSRLPKARVFGVPKRRRARLIDRIPEHITES